MRRPAATRRLRAKGPLSTVVIKRANGSSINLGNLRSIINISRLFNQSDLEDHVSVSGRRWGACQCVAAALACLLGGDALCDHRYRRFIPRGPVQLSATHLALILTAPPPRRRAPNRSLIAPPNWAIGWDVRGLGSPVCANVDSPHPIRALDDYAISLGRCHRQTSALPGDARRTSADPQACVAIRIGR